jgi:hypothetical protein
MSTIRYIALIVCLFLYRTAFCQNEVSLEQYHFVSSAQPYTYMPVMHFRNTKNWYAEARYNYEDQQTFSLFLGKAFTGDQALSWSLVPLIGGSVGRFNGVSTGLNIDLEYNNFYFSAQSQYSVSTSMYKNQFLYSWSEVGYQSLRWLYAGVSLQHTHDRIEGNMLDPGVLVGFTFNKFTIPVYSFVPYNKERYFIVGLNIELNHKKSSKNYPVVRAE